MTRFKSLKESIDLPETINARVDESRVCSLALGCCCDAMRLTFEEGEAEKNLISINECSLVNAFFFGAGALNYGDEG